jgi:ABC-2 type transport system ATP-binding protein
VTGEKQAGEFLTKLVEDKVTVIKFELREPSLHEIFVEKVGDAHEE